MPLWPSRESALVAIAVMAAFGAGLAASFHFDDYALFADPSVASASGWREVWRPEQTRPLTYFTFWLNYRLGGRNPVGYHAFNLGLHAAAAVLLRKTLCRLIPARAALIAAALFALHPIQSEPVIYVFARGTLLATLLCILSLRSWLAERYWPAVGWFASALLAKEECVAFPLVLALLNLARRREQRHWRALTAMLALSLAAGARVLWATAVVPESTAGFRSSVTPWDYFAAQGGVIARYLGLLAWPAGFTVDPEIKVQAGWTAWLAWAGLGILAGLAAARARRPGGASFWFLAGLILLLPSSSIFPVPDLAADRRMYLPLAAFAAMFGILFERVKTHLLVAAGLILAGLSVERAAVWRTEESLWGDAVRLAPGKVRPRIQLARALPPERALAVLDEAWRLEPDNADVAGERGRVWLALGRPAEALPEFGRALALRPGDARALSNRGVALLALGQAEAARLDFERALGEDRCLFDARLNLKRLGVATGDPPGCRYTDEQREALMAR